MCGASCQLPIWRKHVSTLVCQSTTFTGDTWKELLKRYQSGLRWRLKTKIIGAEKWKNTKSGSNWTTGGREIITHYQDILANDKITNNKKMLKVCNLLAILSQRLAMIYHQIRAQKTCSSSKIDQGPMLHTLGHAARFIYKLCCLRLCCHLVVNNWYSKYSQKLAKK